jgi:carbon starvation protein
VLLASGLWWPGLPLHGVIDPNGGINILCRVRDRQSTTAAIALAVATAILAQRRLRFAWVSAAPLAWLVIVTTTAAWQKITSDDPTIGLFAAAHDLATTLAAGALPPDRAAIAPQLIFNQQLDGWLTAFFLALVWIIVVDMVRSCLLHISGRRPAAGTESPRVPTQLA